MTEPNPQDTAADADDTAVQQQNPVSAADDDVETAVDAFAAQDEDDTGGDDQPEQHPEPGA